MSVEPCPQSFGLTPLSLATAQVEAVHPPHCGHGCCVGTGTGHSGVSVLQLQDVWLSRLPVVAKAPWGTSKQVLERSSFLCPLGVSQEAIAGWCQHVNHLGNSPVFYCI